MLPCCRATANRTSRAGCAIEFMDLDWEHCPKLVDFETRRSRIEPEAPNYLTTPKGCFYGGRWHTRDSRPPVVRVGATRGRAPRFCAAIEPSGGGGGDGGDVAAPEPADEMAAMGEAGKERELRTERAASLRSIDSGAAKCTVTGWHAEQRQRGEPGFGKGPGWEKSKYELSPHLRELMYGYGSRHE